MVPSLCRTSKRRFGDGRTPLVRRRAWVMQSRDGGFEFSTPMFVNEACGGATAGFSLSALAVDASRTASKDRLYFGCNQARPSSVVIGASADRGRSWTAVSDVAATRDTLLRRKIMAMTVDAQGTLGVVWLESGHNPAGACADDVYFGVSVDGGQTFLPPARVATAPSCGDKALNGQAWAGDYFGLVADGKGQFRLLWSGVRDHLFQLQLSTIVVASSPR